MLAAVLVTVLIMLVPGTVIGVLSGLRPWTALATSGPIVLGIAGFTAWGTASLGIPYSWQPLLTVWLIACAIALVVRILLPAVSCANRRKAFSEIRSYSAVPSSSSTLTAVFAIAATVVSSVRTLILLNDAPGGAGHIREAWDMQWHTNFLKFIAETGNASSLAAGELSNQETHAEHFYPSAWHAVASLVPGDVFLQANIFSFIAPMVIFPAGMAALTRTVAGPRWAAVAGPVSAVLTLAVPEIWIALLKTSSIPYLLAVAALPAAATLVLRGYTWPAVIALAGLLYTHPAAAVSAALIALLWFLTQPSVDALWRLTLMAVLSSALVFPLLQGVVGESGDVAGFYGQIDVTRSESIWRTFLGISSHTEQADFPVYFMVIAVVGALVLLFRIHPWTPWPVFLMLILGVVADSAQLRWAQPWGGILKVLGTVYYDMPYRIQAVIGILRILCESIAVAFVVSALLWVIRKLRAKNGDKKEDAKPTTVPHDESGTVVMRQSQLFTPESQKVEHNAEEPVTVSAAQLVAVGVLATLILIPASWMNNAQTRAVIPTSDSQSLHMRPAVREALDWLAEQPRAYDGLIVNNYGEGTGWMYAYNGLPSLFRHFSWEDKTATATTNLVTNVDLLTASNPENPQTPNLYDRAAASLRANYVFVSPPTLTTDSTMALSQRSWAWWSPGLTPVYQDGNIAIFAVNRHFSEAELRKIKASSPHTPTSPNPLWTPPRQPIIGIPNETNPLNGARVSFSTSGADIGAINSMLDRTHRLVGADSARDATEIQSALHTIEKKVQQKLSAKGAIVDDAESSQANIVAGFSASESATDTFAVSALIDSSKPSEENSSTWQLAAGLRDALVFRGLGIHSNYGAPANEDKYREGLSPDINAQHEGLAPTVALSMGSPDNAKLLADLKRPQIQEAIANAIVDAFSSILRQAPQPDAGEPDLAEARTALYAS